MSAIEKLQKICAKNPTSILFARLADGLLLQGDVIRAIEVCRQGLRYRPSYVAGHVVMGKCHLAAGHYEEARLEFQKVLQLDADHLSALWHLGKIDLHLRWDELALKHFELALAHDPFCPELMEQICKLKGEALDVSSPEVEQGEEDIVTETQVDDKDVEDEGDAEFVSPKPEVSAPLTEGLDGWIGPLKKAKSERAEPSAIATATLAELYVGQGLVREAVAVLEEVLDCEPDNAEVIARLDVLRNAS